MHNIQYTLFFLINEAPQWISDICQQPPLGRAYKKVGVFTGYIQLKEQLDKLKLEHGTKLWYAVIPRFR